MLHYLSIFTLFSDQLVAFVFRIIVVLQLPRRVQLKIKELMPISATVTDAGLDAGY